MAKRATLHDPHTICFDSTTKISNESQNISTNLIRAGVGPGGISQQITVGLGAICVQKTCPCRRLGHGIRHGVSGSQLRRALESGVLWPSSASRIEIALAITPRSLSIAFIATRAVGIAGMIATTRPPPHRKLEPRPQATTRTNNKV